MLGRLITPLTVQNTYSRIRLARPLKMSALRQPMLLLDKSLQHK